MRARRRPRQCEPYFRERSIVKSSDRRRIHSLVAFRDAFLLIQERKAQSADAAGATDTAGGKSRCRAHLLLAHNAGCDPRAQRVDQRAAGGVAQPLRRNTEQRLHAHFNELLERIVFFRTCACGGTCP
jgi:hypothetical protein